MIEESKDTLHEIEEDIANMTEEELDAMAEDMLDKLSKSLLLNQILTLKLQAVKKVIHSTFGQNWITTIENGLVAEYNKLAEASRLDNIPRIVQKQEKESAEGGDKPKQPTSFWEETIVV